MEKVKKRDKDRFDTLFDPVLSKSSDEYKKQFGNNSKFWGLKDSIGTSLKQDLENNTETVTRFLKFGRIEEIEFLVLLLGTGDYNIDLDGSEYSGLFEVSNRGGFVVVSVAV